MNQKNNLPNYFVLWHISVFHLSERTSFDQSAETTIHKFNNGEEHNSIYTTRAIASSFSPLANKKTPTKSFSTGKTTFTNTFKENKITKKT